MRSDSGVSLEAPTCAHCTTPAGGSKPNRAALGRAVGVAGTARNLNTVRKLIELAR